MNRPLTSGSRLFEHVDRFRRLSVHEFLNSQDTCGAPLLVDCTEAGFLAVDALGRLIHEKPKQAGPIKFAFGDNLERLNLSSFLLQCGRNGLSGLSSGSV